MNYTTMKEVTKDEFFGIINEGKLDVLVRPETKEPGHWYPHTTEFKFRDGTVPTKMNEGTLIAVIAQRRDTFSVGAIQ